MRAGGRVFEHVDDPREAHVRVTAPRGDVLAPRRWWCGTGRRPTATLPRRLLHCNCGLCPAVGLCGAPASPPDIACVHQSLPFAKALAALPPATSATRTRFCTMECKQLDNWLRAALPVTSRETAYCSYVRKLHDNPGMSAFVVNVLPTRTDHSQHEIHAAVLSALDETKLCVQDGGTRACARSRLTLSPFALGSGTQNNVPVLCMSRNDDGHLERSNSLGMMHVKADDLVAIENTKCWFHNLVDLPGANIGSIATLEYQKHINSRWRSAAVVLAAGAKGIELVCARVRLRYCFTHVVVCAENHTKGDECQCGLCSHCRLC